MNVQQISPIGAHVRAMYPPVAARACPHAASVRKTEIKTEMKIFMAAAVRTRPTTAERVVSKPRKRRVVTRRP